MKGVMYISPKEFLKKITDKEGRPVPDWLLGGALCELRNRALSICRTRNIIRASIIVFNMLSIMFVTGITVKNIGNEVSLKYPEPVYIIYAGVLGALLSFAFVVIYSIFVELENLRLSFEEEVDFESIEDVINLDRAPDFSRSQLAVMDESAAIVASLAREVEGKERMLHNAETQNISVAEVELAEAKLMFTEHFNVLRDAKLLPSIEKRSLFRATKKAGSGF